MRNCRSGSSWKSIGWTSGSPPCCRVLPRGGRAVAVSSRPRSDRSARPPPRAYKGGHGFIVLTSPRAFRFHTAAPGTTQRPGRRRARHDPAGPRAHPLCSTWSAGDESPRRAGTCRVLGALSQTCTDLGPAPNCENVPGRDGFMRNRHFARTPSSDQKPPRGDMFRSRPILSFRSA